MLMDPEITVVLRGYARHEVDAAIARAEQALADGSEAARAAAAEELGRTSFSSTWRGYDREDVDGEMRRLRAVLTGREVAAEGGALDFTMVLRGYERIAVERLIAQAAAAQASGSGTERAAAREALANPTFTPVLRGYHPGQVDREIARRRALLH